MTNGIVKTAIFTGLLAILSSTQIKADEIPKQNPEGFKSYFEFIRDGLYAVALNYDNDNDGWVDTRYDYYIFPSNSVAGYMFLFRYGIDLDKNHHVSEDEMIDIPTEESGIKKSSMLNKS
ncbi:hypothetical protein CL621_02005 [archaeon]|nr:hypothetical protein [archaeon]|tara:strand:- start:11 stop:370 length:360 start_codon:yes stop_codon:yes gene_type:complete